MVAKRTPATPDSALATSVTYCFALLGGVSRPSSNACIATGTPPALTIFASAIKCNWCECTPPGDSRPIRWQVPPLRFSLPMKSCSSGLRASSPSATAWSMRGRSCITTRPAPRFIWPTSELPICPSGRPTCSSDASISACGQSRIMACQFGMVACSIALSSSCGRWPQPSRMQSTTGLGRLLVIGLYSSLLFHIGRSDALEADRLVEESGRRLGQERLPLLRRRDDSHVGHAAFHLGGTGQLAAFHRLLQRLVAGEPDRHRIRAVELVFADQIAGFRAGDHDIE